jgi:soluble cytochrome b562
MNTSTTEGTKMEHSVAKALKRRLLDVLINNDPAMAVEVFAMAAMHGDIESLDFIIEKIGNKLDNLEEMKFVRDALADLIKDLDAKDQMMADTEAQAAAATTDLLNKFKL